MNKLKTVSETASLESRRLGADTPEREREIEQRALYERQWLQHKEGFYALQGGFGRFLLQKLTAALGKRRFSSAIVLGARQGEVVSMINADRITVLDIAAQTLDPLKGRCHTIQACLPHTRLKEKSYDLVLCLDLLDSFPTQGSQRLLVSELSRLVTPQGLIALSVELDTKTQEPLETLLDLLSTEMEIESTMTFTSGFLSSIRHKAYEPKKSLLQQACHIIDRSDMLTKGILGLSVFACAGHVIVFGRRISIF